MKPTAIEILQSYKQKIFPLLKKTLTPPKYPTQFSIPNQYQSDFDLVQEEIVNYPDRQGKYLRPTLLYLTANALGNDSFEVINAAVAMQLSEEWILIHDDIEDDSLQRRGQPALHYLYSKESALNAGDALHAIMWHQVSQIQNPAFQAEFYSMIHHTIMGQGIEINWSQDEKLEFSNADWFFLADSKSAYYTIAGPLRLGAILSGASNIEIEILTNFGHQLGRCFQLVDDILDITSDFAGLKKQQGNDIYEGKRTIILGHLLRTINLTDRKKLLQIISKPRSQKKPVEIDWVINQMLKNGSLDYAKSIANKLKENALQILENDITFFKDSETKEQLKTLTNFILTRDH